MAKYKFTIEVKDNAIYEDIEADSLEEAQLQAWDWFNERKPTFLTLEQKEIAEQKKFVVLALGCYHSFEAETLEEATAKFTKEFPGVTDYEVKEIPKNYQFRQKACPIDDVDCPYYTSHNGRCKLAYPERDCDDYAFSVADELFEE